MREVVEEITPVTADIMADADKTEAADAGRAANNNEFPPMDVPPTEHDDEAIDDDELQLLLWIVLVANCNCDEELEVLRLRGGSG